MRGFGFLAVAFLVGLAAPARAEPRRVEFPARDGTMLSGLVVRPGEGRFPGVVALHGCGGLLTGSGKLKARESDWAKRLSAAGYAVLFPDSFNPRGVKSVCSLTERPVLPERERVRDAYDALQWFQKQDYVRADRVALLGWSHGAMNRAVDDGGEKAPGRPVGLERDFVGAVAFYPGCAQVGRELPVTSRRRRCFCNWGRTDEWDSRRALPEAGGVDPASPRPGGGGRFVSARPSWLRPAGGWRGARGGGAEFDL
jgi:dienelactone hydrolase